MFRDSRREKKVEPLTTLFSQMSIESIILFIGAILIAAKAMSEVMDWAYLRLKKYFNVKSQKEEKLDDIIERLDRSEKRSIKRDERVANIENQINLIQNRLQDSTRSYIIDKYHYYVQELGVIDEAALQDIERRYLYYKEAGGDTFIELQMEKLRSLPLVTPEQIAADRKEHMSKLHTLLGEKTSDDGR